jgi:O-glycosyl hydrolase
MNKTRWPSLLLVALAAGSPRAAQSANISATVNPSSVLVANYQGWGTALSWWANVVGGLPNRQTYANLAFSTLKLNIVRYNIGGGENPGITDTLQYRARIPGFEPSSGVWDWNVDANQRWVLREAIALGANHVEAFANSPPWWMTVSGSVTGAAGNGGHNDNLQSAYETAFASYLATVVSHLTVSDGVHFDEATPMNEPEGPWGLGGGQEGCHMDSGQQARMVNDLRSALDSQQALTTGIDAPETYDEPDAATAFRSYGSAANNVTVVTAHAYGSKNPGSLGSLAASLGKPGWISEYGDGDGSGISMARRIHDDITGGSLSAWVYWQFVDNGSGWGMLYNPLNGNGTTSYTTNEKFYVMGQFSEYIRPGFEILNVGDGYSLVAFNPANQTLVIVALNDTSSALGINYNLSGFAKLPATGSAVRTSPTENLASQPAVSIANSGFSATLIPKSVTTFIFNNVSVTGGSTGGPITSGTYRLLNLASGKYLDCLGVSSNGAPVGQWSSSASANQQWAVSLQSDGSYKFSCLTGGRYLDSLGNTANGSPVGQWSSSANNNQRWNIVADGSYYKLINVANSLRLDTLGSTANGAAMGMSSDSTSGDQEWSFTSP